MPETKPRILATRRLPPNVETRLSRDYQASLNADDRNYPSTEILEAAQGHDGILCCSTEKFSADVISSLAESVKILATFSVGYEHIDIPAAERRGLKVTNTPDVLNDATADIAMLCLLAAARRGAEGDRLVRNDEWKGWYTTMMLGTQVSGKRLGIFGMGRIGRAVAQRARGFGMSIHYYNRSRLSEDLEQGATYHETPESLLAVSEFFSINAPSSPETLKFLNAERIALLPDGAVVANTARGNMVDDEALIAALASGKLAAAGLDVFDGEPNIHPGYRSLDNVFMLPHLGSATHETRDAMGFCCLDNFDAFFAGKPCPTPLT
jgi:lactate dehydrogenase-like 2-hydroxyacid dehydrogenase